MKRIPQVIAVNPPKDDTIADRVTRHNPKTYDEKYSLVELEQWIRGMEKIFVILEVPEERKVNIGTFYVTGEVDMLWNTIKDRLSRPEFTSGRFLKELKAQFYPVIIQL